MILTYKDCIEKYGSDHLLKKKLQKVDCFKRKRYIFFAKSLFGIRDY